jgi:hypothetical protein
VAALFNPEPPPLGGPSGGGGPVGAESPNPGGGGATAGGATDGGLPGGGGATLGGATAGGAPVGGPSTTPAAPADNDTGADGEDTGLALASAPSPCFRALTVMRWRFVGVAGGVPDGDAVTEMVTFSALCLWTGGASPSGN